MFNSARVKLTLWYLLIIMVISASFSSVIYRVSVAEVERFDKQQRTRFERYLREGGIGPRTPTIVAVPNPDLVNETKERIIWNLFFINGVIFLVAGGLGYFLATRTLQPIQEMVDDQKRFISDSSHELRTPLTSLKMAFEVYLRDKKKSLSDANQLVKDSLEDINKLQNLTDSLLHLVRYENQTQRHYFQKTNTEDVVQKALKKIEPQAQDKHIIIKPTIKRETFFAIQDQIVQLLVILLDNAIKYSSPKSKVLVTAHSTKKSVVFEVQDFGIGIEKAHLPHIFDRFFRSDKARSKTQSNGYGLGLAIANKIVELHHGHITVQSKPDAGTIFTVVLPLSHKS